LDKNFKNIKMTDEASPVAYPILIERPILIKGNKIGRDLDSS
jgi:hypothetical protein